MPRAEEQNHTRRARERETGREMECVWEVKSNAHTHKYSIMLSVSMAPILLVRLLVYRWK